MKRSNSLFWLVIVFFVVIFALWSKLHNITRDIGRINHNAALRQGDCYFSFYQSDEIKQEIFNERLIQKFNTLRKNLDDRSNKVLDYAIRCIQREAFLKSFMCRGDRIKFSEQHRKHELLQKKEMEKQISDKTYPGISYLAPEVFYFHHGLRFANKQILNYIKNKDILDCGAFVGDSVLILKDYSPRMIYSYEFSKASVESFKKTMQLNRIDSRYKLITKALGDKSDRICVDTKEGPSGWEQLKATDNGYLVDITTIDEEAKKHKFNVGFLKIDVEGAGMKVIKGAINTIKQQRPVMSIAVYHNNEELFGIKPFLESQLKDYVFEFQFLSFYLGSIIELTLFCYPKELKSDK